jgi:hypothetical protein
MDMGQQVLDPRGIFAPSTYTGDPGVIADIDIDIDVFGAATSLRSDEADASPPVVSSGGR